MQFVLSSILQEKDHSPPLISRFTIAILSGILIGMGIGCQMPFAWGAYAVTAGSIGGVYYLLANQRLQKRQSGRLREMRRTLEKRLTTHVHRPDLQSGSLPSLQKTLY